MRTTPLIMLITLLIFSGNPLGQSKINSADSGKNPAAKAKVNFVIKIPAKLSISIKNGLLTSTSNTGSLYMGTTQNNQGDFRFEGEVITQQKSKPGSYIVATP